MSDINRVYSSQRYSSTQTASRGTNGHGCVIGNGYSSHLKAAQYNGDRSQTDGAKVCSGIFITRLLPKTTDRQVTEHIKNATGYSVKAQKLQTKFTSYSSCYVRCSQAIRTSLMDASVWPGRTLVKLYYDF